MTLNPGIGISDEPITVVRRSDGSGTTSIFSNYLSTVDPTWKAQVEPARLSTGRFSMPG
jgi:phosphate transport system substrate-binding protein